MLEGSARQVRESDFRRFDLLIALDRSNLRDLLAIAPDEEAAEKVRLLREFDPASADGDLDGAAGELQDTSPHRAHATLAT